MKDRKQKQRSKSKPKHAQRIQKKPAKRNLFPSDAESIELRREGATREAARVVRRESFDRDGFYGDFEVTSSQWETPYHVEIRSLTETLNSCDCQDHRMNRLGTCKHIERVLQHLAHRRKRRFKQAGDLGSPVYEVFFEMRTDTPRPKLLRPAKRVPAIDKKIAAWFDASGDPLGTPIAIWPEIASYIARRSPQTRRRIRLSRHADYWLARERQPIEMQRLRSRFDAEVAAGRRTENPVRLPLYDYQKEGMRHLAFKGRALLADDMGLGKTVQAIAAVEILRQLGAARRVLVVSPASLKTEWEAQIAQFTGIRVTPVFGPRAARLRRYTQEHPFTLCNYEQVRIDVDDINRLMVPDIVILDEAQRIKNWPTKTAKTIKRLQSPFAFVLTGTPLENRIEELYSLVEFVDPHLFGSLFRFQRNFMELTEDNEVRPKNLDQLHRIVSQVMLRRRKSDVEDALPRRSDKNFFVSMTKEQQQRYGEYHYEAAMIAAILKHRPLTKQEAERLQILLACMRMVCDTPYILDPECRDCPKLDELENILDELLSDPTVKVIVFSEWVRMLDLVRELFDAKNIGYAQHTGRIPQQKRRMEINRFKKDAACRVFLSSESGGTGLNLQAASVVINLDLPWNPARLEQRIARAWRKHQPRSVRVLNLVAENTIEHNMLGKLAYKTALADSVLDGAEFKPPKTSETGRRSFAERVSALLSGEPASEADTVRVPEMKTITPDERLVQRHAKRILGIEKSAATGARLIVARSDTDARTLRGDPESVNAQQAVVIPPETRDLLLQLQSMGLLTLAPDLTTLHAGEGYAPIQAAKPEPPALCYDAARKCWKAADSELKAVRALDEIGLYDQAAPHLTAVLQTGRAAIAALYDCAPDALPADTLPRHRRIMQDLERFSSQDSLTADRFNDALNVAGEIEKILP